MQRILLSALAVLLGGVLLANNMVSAQSVKLTPKNTKIGFVGTKPNGKHVGGFSKFSGTITFPSSTSAGKISVTIQTTSLFSDNAKLTRHLKSPDFFNVRNKPKATFVSTKIAASDAKGATHNITGKLTLLGKTKSITFPATIGRSGDRPTLQSTFYIDRTQFGMTYGRGKINDKVKITVQVNGGK